MREARNQEDGRQEGDQGASAAPGDRYQELAGKSADPTVAVVPSGHANVFAAIALEGLSDPSARNAEAMLAFPAPEPNPF